MTLIGSRVFADAVNIILDWGTGLNPVTDVFIREREIWTQTQQREEGKGSPEADCGVTCYKAGHARSQERLERSEEGLLPRALGESTALWMP